MADHKKRVGDRFGQIDSGILESFHKALKDADFASRQFSLLMNHQTSGVYNRTGSLAKSFHIPIGGYGKVPIYLSNNVPDDTVYMVETSIPRYSRTAFIPQDIERLDEIKLYVQRAMEYAWLYGDAEAEKVVKPTIKIYRWRRLDNESLEVWGMRLHASGAIDIPEVRWEYQKAVMSAPIRWLQAKLSR